ncbi:tail tube TT1 domain-containing protein [Mammaliicoccus sciuri]|uniref:tail tube TT1 domain-containing protein n=1 Tax=Mammaliicoccus sciuri TaxID=1296 RepID=UPI00162487E3|nr:phage tail protein [Mammaliicoccus sciuri]
MPILIKNLIGKGFPVSTSTNLNEKVSSDGSLTFDIIENDETREIVSSISKMWTVTNVDGYKDKREYKIIMIDRQARGDKNSVSITAIQRELHDLKKSRVYENMTGSFTAFNYFTSVFRNSGYKFKLTTKPSSSRWENAGDGASRLDMFQDGLKRYGLEYTYDESTKTFTLTSYVENAVKYYISSEVNANNIKLEDDANEMCTFIKGYGGFEEEDDFRTASLQIEFTHPLASVYGKLEAEPIIDGRITSESTMKALLESRIDESFKTSLSLDFVVLQKDFPEAIPKLGDIVPVRDDVLDLNEEVRIIEINTQRDAHNNIVKQDVTLGDPKRRDRYMKNVNKAVKIVTGLGSGISNEGDFKVVANKVNAVTSIIQKNNLTSEEKSKLDQVTPNSITLTGDDNKKYNIEIVDGKLKATLIGG